jgi:hypothetical protein
MNNIYKRLQTVVNKVALSGVEFCDTTGIHQIDLIQILNRAKDISYTHIYQICKAYPQINTDWLITGKGKMQKDINKTESEYLKINIKITNTRTISLNIARKDEFHYRQTGIILREKIAAYKMHTNIIEEKVFDLASYSFAKKMTSNINSNIYKDAYKLYKSVCSQYSTQVSPEKLNLVVAFHLTYLSYMTDLQNYNE